MTDARPTERFSNRAENYVKYRPGYPAAIIPFLAAEGGLLPSHLVADVGSGTGILSELFLKHGNRVLGIEPNAKMREAGERQLTGYAAFKSIAATAENTRLPSASVDFVVAGQAFHWFEPVATRHEFSRILKPHAQVALIWNDRKESDPLGEEYEKLLKDFGTDYANVSAKYRGGEEEIQAFFSGGELRSHIFENSQTLDYLSFEGRLLSASYAPQAGEPNHEPMIRALKGVFQRHQNAGLVHMNYDTRVYWGQLGSKGST